MSDKHDATVENLKECYGAFPVSPAECYVCPDEKKCFRLSMMKTQTQILGWIQAIDSTNRLLFSINDTIDEVKPGLETLNAHLKTVSEKLLQ